MGDSYNELTAEETYVIQQKGTERPFVGAYTDHFDGGHYVCKRCDQSTSSPLIVDGLVLMTRLRARSSVSRT